MGKPKDEAFLENIGNQLARKIFKASAHLAWRVISKYGLLNYCRFSNTISPDNNKT